MQIHSIVLTVRIELSERGLCWGERPEAHWEVGTGVRTAKCRADTYMVVALLYMNTDG